MKPERLKALSRNFIQARPISLICRYAHLPVPAVMTCLGLNKRDSSD